MLSPEQQRRGVVAASAGNHALALAYHGKCLGVPVTTVMPTVAPLAKRNRCEFELSANVVIHGGTIAEAPGCTHGVAIGQPSQQCVTQANQPRFRQLVAHCL